MASIKLKGDTSGEITISAPAVAGTTTLELPATSSTLATQNALGVRNLIINGDMRIAQRGTSAVTASGSFPVDRFYVNNSSDAAFSAEQSTDVPSGQGFTSSLKVTYTTGDSSIGATQYSNIQHNIEGNNVAHLGFGSSGAKSVTLSFWVKASVTGQYSYAIYNSAENRINPQPFTINSANTWEYKTITYDGDTTGTWLTDNGKGLTATLYTALGSNFLSSAGWNASSKYGVTGQANAMATTNNTFFITGVQLEVGSATEFEHRPYDMELQRCMRYYETFYLEWYPVSWSNAFRGGRQYFRVFKRASPTGSVKSGTITYALLGIYTVSANSNTGLNIVETNDGFFISHSRQAGGTAPTNGLTYFNETGVTLQFDAEL